MIAALVIDVADWRAVGTAAVSIRDAVFVSEQGVPAELEHDGRDLDCRHVLVRTREGVPIATGRLLPDGHIGRVAVLPAWRGQGVGRDVMLALIGEASRRGHAEVLLNSQASAVPFYLGLGFSVYGAPFVEAGIPHQAMRFSLVRRSPTLNQSII